MATVYNHMKPFKQRVWHFCFQRINELENTIKESTNELEFFKQLQKEQNRCESCNGTGDIGSYVDIDERVVVKCDDCNGSGEKKEA